MSQAIEIRGESPRCGMFANNLKSEDSVPAAEDMACRVDSAAPRTPSFSILSIRKLPGAPNASAG